MQVGGPSVTVHQKSQKIRKQRCLSRKTVVKQSVQNSKRRNRANSMVKLNNFLTKGAELQEFGKSCHEAETPFGLPAKIIKKNQRNTHYEKETYFQKVASGLMEPLAVFSTLNERQKAVDVFKIIRKKIGTKGVPKIKGVKQRKKVVRSQTMVNWQDVESDSDAYCTVAYDTQAIGFKGQLELNYRSKKISKNAPRKTKQVKPKISQAKTQEQKQKISTSSACNKRPETIPEQKLETDAQIRKMLKSKLDNVMQTCQLPKDNYLVETTKNYIGSYHFKKTLAKRKAKELAKLVKINLDYTEIVFNEKDHGKKLVGLFARQYDVSFFEDSTSEKFIQLLKDIDKQLLSKYKQREKRKLKKLLKSDANQLLLIFDKRVPRVISRSSNRDTVTRKQGDKSPRMVGFAVFQQTRSDEQPALFVHRLFGKDRRKTSKKQVLLALRTTQQQYRAQEILIPVSDRDIKLYIKLGYKISNYTKEELENFGIDQTFKRKIFTFETLLKNRDIKKDIVPLKSTELRAKAIKLKKAIEKQKVWIKINQKKMQTIIEKKVRSYAVKSDQAKTPKWLFNKIKRYCHLTQEQLKDVFVYQEGWTTRAFYDGYKRRWNKKQFHYVNSPFTQVYHAIKKCAEFQSEGGNCAMILPTISITKNPFYDEILKHTTVRVDLPLFPFEGYKDPLMKHIVLLYFLTPEFVNDLITKNEKKTISTDVIIQEDQTKLKIQHLPQPLSKGRKKTVIPDSQKDEFLELYLEGKSLNFIKKKASMKYQTVRSILEDFLSVEMVDQEQGRRKKHIYSDHLYKFIAKKYF